MRYAEGKCVAPNKKLMNMKRVLKLMAMIIMSLMFTSSNAQYSNASVCSNIEDEGAAVFSIQPTAYCMQSSLNVDAEALHTTLKYCTNKIERGLSIAGSEAKIAIQIPTSKAEELKGNFITKIWIGLADVKSLDMGKLFVLTKLLSNPIHLQDIDAKKLRVGWNEIELSTPIEITGVELFIGYQFQYGKGVSPFGISLNGANPLGGWTCTNSSWLKIGDSNIDGNHSIKVIISGDNLSETYDLVVEELKAKEYVTINTPINMTGKILNAGTKITNNFDIVYAINGVANTYSVKDLTLANDADYSFTIPLIFETNGTYNIDVQIANINGGGEDVNPDNNAGNVKVVAVTKHVRKKMLLEYFTSQLAVPEPDSKAYTEMLLNGNSGVIWVGYHYDDMYALPENVSLYGFYGVGALPENMLDRMPYKGDMTFNPKSLDAAVLLDKLDNSAFMTVAIDGIYNPKSRSLEFNVLGDFTGNELEGKDLRLNVLIAEDGLTTENQIGLGHHEYSPTVRAYLTEVSGKKIKQVSGGSYKANFSYEVPLEFDAEKSKIVAFVNAYNDNPADGTEVMNAEMRYLGNMISNTVEESIEDVIINVYPNPAKNVLHVDGKFTSVVIYNMAGMIVKSCDYDVDKIDVSDLEPGIFIVKAINSDGFATKKVTIMR